LVVAHGSGIDEIAFVALPLLVFAVFQWLNRRRRRPDGAGQNGGTGTNASAGR
jgi:hypothetical protein